MTHEILPGDANALLAKGALLLDVREHDEWAEAHVDDSTHIPLGELAGRVHELPQDRTIVCMCRSGRRSAQALQTLLDGRKNKPPVYNLTGGILAWTKAGLPTVRDA